jgi:hypothetical protein
MAEILIVPKLIPLSQFLLHKTYPSFG